MDYSLLVGIKRKTFFVNKIEQQPSSRGDGEGRTRVTESTADLSILTDTSSPLMMPESLPDEGDLIDAAAVEGAGNFKFGIIDILQDWNWSKWNERMFKIYVLQKDGSGLSAIEPKLYRKRFMQRAVLDVFANVDYLPVENPIPSPFPSSSPSNTLSSSVQV